MVQNTDDDLFDDILKHWYKGNTKKVLKIVDKQLKVKNDHQIKIFKILIELTKDTQKFDAYMEDLTAVAQTKPTHPGVIEALVSCCVLTNKELVLINLLNMAIDTDKVCKESAVQLFTVSSHLECFVQQIKAARFLQTLSEDSMYTLWSIMCGYLNHKYSAEFIDQPIETCVPVTYACKKLESLVYQEDNKCITSINLLCHIFKSAHLYHKLLLFLTSEESKTTLISSFTKADLRMECYYNLQLYDYLIDFCTTIMNKNNVYSLQEYLIKAYERLLRNPTNYADQLALIEKTCLSSSNFPLKMDHYFQINFQLVKYRVMKSSLADIYQNIHQYFFRHPSSMTVINFLPHVKFLGRELLNYIDSKQVSSISADNPNIQSAFTFFKTVIGMYNELGLENKRNILIKKLETINDNPDDMSKKYVMFSIIELLFSIADANTLISHYHLFFVVICLLKNFFPRPTVPHLGVLMLHAMKHIGLNIYDKFNPLGLPTIKNILLETMPNQFETKFIIGDYTSALDHANDIINFQHHSVRTINRNFVSAYQLASWKIIEETIVMKYQFLMSYKAISAKLMSDYYYIYLSPQRSDRRERNLYRRCSGINFEAMHTPHDMPRFYINNDEYEWVNPVKPYLVDNTDYSLVNYCQSITRTFTNEFRAIFNRHKLFVIRVRQTLIKFSQDFNDLSRGAFNIDQLKQLIAQMLSKIQKLNEEFENLPELPRNHDLILVDGPAQSIIWKKYNLLSILVEHYGEIESTLNNQPPSVHSMEYMATCNNLKFVIRDATESKPIEKYLEVMNLSTFIVEIFSILIHDFNTFKSYAYQNPPESKQLKDFMVEKITKVHTQLSDTPESLLKCIQQLQAPSTTVDISERYFEFLLPYFDQKHFNTTVQQIKDYYSEVIKQLSRQFTTTLTSVKL